MKPSLIWGALAAALALSCASLASAQVQVPVVRDTAGRAIGATAVITVDASGNYVVPGVGVTTATSTQTAGTVATANTFQSVLAASSTRRGCLIVNTSAAVEYVFLGAPGSATIPSSFPLAAGQSFSCVAGRIVVADQISMTSATAGASFVVAVQ